MTTPTGAVPADAAAAHPSFLEAFRFWVKLGFISFGGPTGQIAIMHEELVERKRWISDARFLHALNYCMLLPGPEATQLAVYVGWLLHRIPGGLVAGALFVIPSIFILWGLSYIYAAHGNAPWIAAAFYGLKPAVTAIVAFAVIRIGRKALKNGAMWALAALAFVAIFFLDVPFPLIVLGAGLVGLVGGRLSERTFHVLSGHAGPEGGDPGETAGSATSGGGQSGGERHGATHAGSVLDDLHEVPPHAHPSTRRALEITTVGLLLWFLPVVAAGLWQGWDGTLAQEGIFFSKAALVTFGGAYAVLPYVAQKAVEDFRWLAPGQMLDGLGLAETTPGPLIMVVQFVGFMGGWNRPGGLDPLAAATLGALLTTWVTFVPCFLWIFLGGPWVERLRGDARLGSALSAITAAIVGVVLNLAVWFALHVFFPDGRGVDVFAVAVALVAFLGMSRWGWGIVPVVAGGAVAGLLHRAVIG